MNSPGQLARRPLSGRPRANIHKSPLSPPSGPARPSGFGLSAGQRAEPARKGPPASAGGRVSTRERRRARRPLDETLVDTYRRANATLLRYVINKWIAQPNPRPRLVLQALRTCRPARAQPASRPFWLYNRPVSRLLWPSQLRQPRRASRWGRRVIIIIVLLAARRPPCGWRALKLARRSQFLASGMVDLASQPVRSIPTSSTPRTLTQTLHHSLTVGPKTMKLTRGFPPIHQSTNPPIHPSFHPSILPPSTPPPILRSNRPTVQPSSLSPIHLFTLSRLTWNLL